ncbi:hypothetical protein PR001_g1810 [Phytophthora rubi]|uniref:Tubby C-terminal domain-containing protein n=2 Tax=Phytophthora rubi TaxID=129364 RepID=A0A6A3NKN2_9STRA|nr:hypothetical protein PR002_g1885 [Phytophthora rubi]KAE9051046.1 hypothetical protein PR001_g1810 [Phytophthora rubi]
MGNTNSADLESPLQAPSGSMQALDGSIIAQCETNLQANSSTFQTSATVKDLATNNPIILFKGKMLSSRVMLETPEGQIIACIKNNSISSKYHIFQGDQTDEESFIIDTISGFFSTMVLVAEFTDRQTGTPCRIVAKGNPSDKAVLCYLERGSPTLSQLKRSDDFTQNQDRYERVGRICRKSHFTTEDYFIEAPAGVDLTLLLLIWHVRHAWLLDERTSAPS